VKGRPGRLLRAVAGALGAAFVGLNLLAYHHARALTHFAASGARTQAPERLSWTQRAGVLLTGATLPRPENRRTPADGGLAYEGWQFPAADGVPLEGWWVPHDASRGTVLLFHGYADSKDSVLAAAREFHAGGRACLLVDFRGSGGSGGGATSLGYHEAQDVLGALAAAAKRGAPRPLVLFGPSMGGVAALRAVGDLAAMSDALILQYPYDHLLTTTRNRFRAVGVPAFPFAEALIFWGGVQQGFDGLRFGPADSARRVTQPTLLMCGERDERVRPQDCRRIFDALAGPKRLEMFPGAGHESLLAADPERWRGAVSDLLDRLR
jgi:alpha-beta hydrolase superfamily lysophospholipase